MYPTISHASIRFNSRWLLPLLLITSPFWNKKKRVGIWATENSCILERFYPWHLEDSSYRWGRGHLCPTHGRATRLGRVQQHTVKALLCHPQSSIFPNISSFMCKAGKSSKRLCYLQGTGGTAFGF